MLSLSNSLATSAHGSRQANTGLRKLNVQRALHLLGPALPALKQAKVQRLSLPHHCALSACLTPITFHPALNAHGLIPGVMQPVQRLLPIVDCEHAANRCMACTCITLGRRLWRETNCADPCSTFRLGVNCAAW